MRAHLTPRLLALFLIAAPVLAGCSATPDDQPPPAATFGCPRAGLMPSGDRLAVFSDMANPSRETATVKAQLYGMNYVCKPVPRRGEIEVALTARFVADRMPLAGDMKGLTLPYYIAVLDERDEIIAHRRFDIRLVFGEGSKNIASTQARAQADHVIPVPAPTALAANGYKIVAGFELIPAQVRYNRGDAVLVDPPAPEPAPRNRRTRKQ